MPSSKKKLFNKLYIYYPSKQTLLIIECKDPNCVYDYGQFYNYCRNLHNLMFKFVDEKDMNNYLFPMTEHMYKTDFTFKIEDTVKIMLRSFEEFNDIIIKANFKFAPFAKRMLYKQKINMFSEKKNHILKCAYTSTFKRLYKHSSVKQAIAPINRSLKKYRHSLKYLPKIESSIIIEYIFSFIITHGEIIYDLDPDFLEFLDILFPDSTNVLSTSETN